MFRRTRRRKSNPFKGKQSTMHVPSVMGTVLATNTYTLQFLAVPNEDVGGSVTAIVSDQDRGRVCPTGSIVGKSTFTIGIENAVNNGTLNYIILKVERKLAVPAINVDTMPSAAGILTAGMQQAFRMLNPGRIIKYGTVGFSATQNITREIKVDWNKFKMARVRAGDYYLIAMFNRSGGNVEVHNEMRYKCYT